MNSTKITAASVHAEVEVLRTEMGEMKSTLDQILAALNAQAQKPAPKTTKKAEAPKQPVEFIRADGTKTMAKSQKQADAWKKWQESSNPEVAAQVKANKAKEPAICRELEKRLGAPEGTFQKSSFTHEEAVAAGFKGTRKQLKELKTEVRAMFA